MAGGPPAPGSPRPVARCPQRGGWSGCGPFAGFATLYYLLALGFATLVVDASLAAAQDHRRLVAHQSLEGRTDTWMRELGERLSLGLYRGAREKGRAVDELYRETQSAERTAERAALAFAGLGLGFLLLAGTGAGPPGAPPRRLVTHLLGVSALCLVVGVAAPVLTVSAHQDLALLGRVVVQHDTKGILATIGGLWAVGNLLLASLLALFSLVLPVAKLLAAAVVVLGRRVGLRRASLRLVDLVGRWSMTDVFVVAVLVAFLAADTGRVTEASVGLGLWFFAAYALLSLLAGHLLVRHRSAFADAPPPGRVPGADA